MITWLKGFNRRLTIANIGVPDLDGTCNELRLVLKNGLLGALHRDTDARSRLSQSLGSVAIFGIER